MNEVNELTSNTNSVAAQELKSYIDRIEKVSEELDGIKSDLKDIYAEAGSNGFDKKVLRKIIARRKRERAEVQEEDALTELYLQALGEL
jgi:uncharacterized protein (UPF0335 family)